MLARLYAARRRVSRNLTPTLLGEKASFYKYGQTALAAWITMFVMTADFLDTNAVSITAEERSWFKAHQRPPVDWRIWIGRYEKPVSARRWIHSVLDIVEDDAERLAGGTPVIQHAQRCGGGKRLLCRLISYVFPKHPHLRNFAQALCNTILGYHTPIHHVKSGRRAKKKPLFYKGLFLFEVGCGGLQPSRIDSAGYIDLTATALREWAYARAYQTSDQRAADLPL